MFSGQYAVSMFEIFLAGVMRDNENFYLYGENLITQLGDQGVVKYGLKLM